MQMLIEISTALGALAMVAIAVFLLSRAQRKMCVVLIDGINGARRPGEWFGQGFFNAVVACDGNSAASTVFGYAYSKMLSQKGVLYSLLGIAVAPLGLFVLVMTMLSLGDLYLVALPVIGVGYLILMISNKVKEMGRVLMALGLLAFSTFLFSRSFGVLFSKYLLGGEIFLFTSHGVFAILLGIGVGTIIATMFRGSYVMIVFGAVLWSMGGLGLEFMIGLFIGFVVGGAFVMVPMAAKAGTIAKRAFLQHFVGVLFAIVIFCVAYQLAFKFFAKADETLVFMGMYAVFLAVLLPLGSYFSEWLARPIVYLVPNAPKEGSHLVMLSNTHRPDPTLSLLQVKNEIVNHTRRTYKMLSFLRDILNEGCEQGAKNETLYERIKKYKAITDRVENEIVGYICSVAQGDISRLNTIQMQEAIVAMSKVNQIAEGILNTSSIVYAGMCGERVWDETQLGIISGSVQKLQQLQFAVISLMEDDKKNEELKAKVEKIRGELDEIICSSNNSFYLYNQVLLIEALGEMKKISKLLCNLVK